VVALADGDGLQLEDGRWLKVQAAAELIVEVRHKDLNQRMRLAWHLGNRHCLPKFETSFFAFGPTMWLRICFMASGRIL
jgi:urease accessory protein UreE